jgi:hypothetical protein
MVDADAASLGLSFAHDYSYGFKWMGSGVGGSGIRVFGSAG